MLPERRHQQILELLRAEGPVRVESLADFVGASPATVRRDLAQLDRNGLVTRLHGGAVVRDDAEPPFAQVATSNLAHKQAIGRAAATLVHEGDVLLLDIGTTTLCLAQQLHGRSITVITTNLAVYEELGGDPAVQLVLLGGVVRRNYRSLVGFLAEDALRQVHADIAFLGASGVRPDGDAMDTTHVEVPIKRAMIAAAERTVLLVDEAKLPGSGFVRVCGPQDFSVLVTDAAVSADTTAIFREAGVEVVQACD